MGAERRERTLAVPVERPKAEEGVAPTEPAGVRISSDVRPAWAACAWPGLDEDVSRLLSCASRSSEKSSAQPPKAKRQGRQ